jgi:glyoxylate reductase
MSEIWDAKLNSEDKVYSQSELIELSRDCDGILCSIVDKFDAETINKLSDKVRIISNFAVGFGNIDIKAAMNKNIIVTNTPDVLTDATAEIAILILLGAARRATEGRKWVDKKNWTWSADFLIGKQLTDSRLGILGMGRIGQALAERAKSFGMKIHYHNRKKLPPNLEKGAIYHESLKSLILVSDFFSINCPTTEETKKIINEETLSYFLNGAVIINSARGDMIDDEAMINALKSGKVFALGLDVYNGEPDIHPQYLKLDNVFILPHLGSATEKTRFAMADLAISNIEEYFKTGKCKNTVN